LRLLNLLFAPQITDPEPVSGDIIMLVPMKVDYGVRTLVYLALQEDAALRKSAGSDSEDQNAPEFTSTSDIASAQHIPEPYLLRICSELQKSGLIESRRGPQGGHKLAKSSDTISVSDVVNSVDYSLAPIDCVEEPEGCRLSGACSQRELWSDIENMLLEHLSKVKISELMSQQLVMTAAAVPVKVNF
jgi:Rrf2 family protein